MTRAAEKLARTRPRVGKVEVGGVRVAAFRLHRRPSRRTPLVLVDVLLDGVPITFAYARLRRDVEEVRPPEDPDGRAAIIADRALRDRVKSAVIGAVKADPVAAKHVLNWRWTRPV
jgi:hypothetical protein